MATQITDPAIPQGYYRNSEGHLVHESLVNPVDLARSELVLELVALAQAAHRSLIELKEKAFGDVDALIQLSAEKYGAKVGGKKGNVTLYSYDGRYKIQVARADNLNFDERLQAAKVLIDQCLAAWTENSGPEVKAIVQQAFDVDKEGKISTSRVLGLRRLQIEDERWLRAMQAIGDSVQVTGTTSYVRFYERVGSTNDFRAISLDMAKL